MIEAVVADVDQSKLEPLVDKTELPQLSVTETIGTDGTNKGLPLIVAGRLVQLPLF